MAGVTTLQLPYVALIRRVDPDFYRDRARELEYVFSQRRFYGNSNDRGAYAEDFLSDENDDILLAENGAYLLVDES